MEKRTPALEIDAGPAGLAVSACLKKHGVEHVVLDREHEVAPRWSIVELNALSGSRPWRHNELVPRNSALRLSPMG